MTTPMPATPELSRPVRLRQIDARPVQIEANEAERAALADRFALPAVNTLTAEIALERDGEKVRAHGTMAAQIHQTCAVSGEEFPVSLTEDIGLVFLPLSDFALPAAMPADDEPIEIELERDELDEIEYEGDTIDLGEAVAQTLGLAIDPYAEGSGADAARTEAGLEEAAARGPLADMLDALKKG